MKKTNWLLLVLALVLSMFLAACSGGDENTGNDGEGDGAETEELQKVLTKKVQIRSFR